MRPCCLPALFTQNVPIIFFFLACFLQRYDGFRVRWAHAHPTWTYHALQFTAQALMGKLDTLKWKKWVRDTTGAGEVPGVCVCVGVVCGRGGGGEGGGGTIQSSVHRTEPPLIRAHSNQSYDI
jgi:hypothetical protein